MTPLHFHHQTFPIKETIYRGATVDALLEALSSLANEMSTDLQKIGSMARGGAAVAGRQNEESDPHDSVSADIFNVIVQRSDDATLSVKFQMLLSALHQAVSALALSQTEYQKAPV